MGASLSLPHVSIIIPMYNEARRVEPLLESLFKQTYPSDRVEIIITDNNSSDDTIEKIRYFGRNRITILSETLQQNADAARNTGIAAATGDILAFTDADCLPDCNWIRNAVLSLLKNKADLVAGGIHFTFSNKPTAAEAYDSVSFLQHHISVPERGLAFTANLFVRCNVFKEIGAFDTTTVWNGDVLFTASATRAGYKLIFSSQAIVRHPARTLRPLLIKSWRIAYGKGLASHTVIPAKEMSLSGAKAHIRNLNPWFLLRKLAKSEVKISYFQATVAIGVAYLVPCVGLAGFGAGCLAKAAPQLEHTK